MQVHGSELAGVDLKSVRRHPRVAAFAVRLDLDRVSASIGLTVIHVTNGAGVPSPPGWTMEKLLETERILFKLELSMTAYVLVVALARPGLDMAWPNEGLIP
jgi:hypothetical protein